jgi:hypothetical protein
MPDPILDVKEPGPEIYQRIGQVAADWAYVEMLLGEMLAHFCHADHGSMYVITQNVAIATVTGWLRTLVEIKVKDATAAKVISDLLTDVDDTRTERNVVVHGVWKAADEPGFAWVQTFKWDRQEVARNELWSTGDLDALIQHIAVIQLMLANLGDRMGFLKFETR